MAEEFQKGNAKVRVTVGMSGTGGGFKKFAHGEIDISAASRPIEASEINLTKQNKIEFMELEVAYDGIAIVVNPKNDWATSLSMVELKKIWQPENPAKLWSDVRPAWPKRPIKLYGPGTDSGTFDYFTKVVNGKEKSCRADYTASEDDNVLVQGVSGDKDALGYFGFSYFEANKSRLKALAVEFEGKTQVPTTESIRTATYKPLSRPLYIYVNLTSAKRKEVEQFVLFYLTEAPKLIPEVGYVPLDQKVYDQAIQRFRKRPLKG
jgi:phosphate transport system substrate-binding protein